jgi:uncharacterized membrane protein (DUF485 family)
MVARVAPIITLITVIMFITFITFAISITFNPLWSSRDWNTLCWPARP